MMERRWRERIPFAEEHVLKSRSVESTINRQDTCQVHATVCAIQPHGLTNMRKHERGTRSD